MARLGLKITKKIVASGEYTMVILDEINEAIDFNLTPLDEVIHLIKNRPPALDFTLTGPYAYPEVIALADIVSEVVDTHYHAMNK